MRRSINLLGALGAAVITTVLAASPALAGVPGTDGGLAPEAAVTGSAGLTADAAKLDRDPGKALDKYWTAERMATAIPADRLVADNGKSTVMPSRLPAGQIGGSAPTEKAITRDGVVTYDVSSGTRWPNRYDTPAYTNGKVFFTKGGAGYVCSGAVINSEARNTVFTAGHCVHGGRGGTWHSNWVFVPNYYFNDRPVGTWYARQLWSLNGWMNDSDNSYDIGAVVMWNNSSNQRIADVTGSQGIEWNGSRGQFVYHWAYPAEPNPPFNGESLQYCTGTTFNEGFLGIGGDLGLNCNMQGGASGGIWVRAFNGTWGYTISLNSYHKGSDLSKIYGPYFGDGVANLYNAVRYLY
jgi:hypothetical protein